MLRNQSVLTCRLLRGRDGRMAVDIAGGKFSIPVMKGVTLRWALAGPRGPGGSLPRDSFFCYPLKQNKYLII